jgi:hypothetical protein
MCTESTAKSRNKEKRAIRRMFLFFYYASVKLSIVNILNFYTSRGFIMSELRRVFSAAPGTEDLFRF